MMRYGIPSYRLPRDVLDAEIERIAALGVQLTTGHRVEDLAEERETGNFDAVFVAVGAHLAKRVNIPSRDARSLIDAVSFLHQVAAAKSPNSEATSRSTAAATPPWTPPASRAGSARRTP